LNGLDNVGPGINKRGFRTGDVYQGSWLGMNADGSQFCSSIPERTVARKNLAPISNLKSFFTESIIIFESLTKRRRQHIF
jgi:hypothetical protein